MYLPVNAERCIIPAHSSNRLVNFFSVRFKVRVIQTWVNFLLVFFTYSIVTQKQLFTINVDSIIRSFMSPFSFFRTQQYHVNATSTINKTPATGMRIFAKRGRGLPSKKYSISTLEDHFGRPFSCNISNTRDSVSSGYPNTEKRVENTPFSELFGRNSRCLNSR